MKFKKVEYPDGGNDDCRIVSAFLFIPKTINGETRAFSVESWSEQKFRTCPPFSQDSLEWIPIKWID